MQFCLSKCRAKVKQKNMKVSITQICQEFLQNRQRFEALMVPIDGDDDHTIAFTDLPADEQLWVVEEAIEQGVEEYLTRYTPNPHEGGCAYDQIAHEMNNIAQY